MLPSAKPCSRDNHYLYVTFNAARREEHISRAVKISCVLASWEGKGTLGRGGKEGGGLAGTHVAAAVPARVAREPGLPAAGSSRSVFSYFPCVYIYIFFLFCNGFVCYVFLLSFLYIVRFRVAEIAVLGECLGLSPCGTLFFVVLPPPPPSAPFSPPCTTFIHCYSPPSPSPLG